MKKSSLSIGAGITTLIVSAFLNGGHGEYFVRLDQEKILPIKVSLDYMGCLILIQLAVAIATPWLLGPLLKHFFGRLKSAFIIMALIVTFYAPLCLTFALSHPPAWGMAVVWFLEGIIISLLTVLISIRFSHAVIPAPK